MFRKALVSILLVLTLLVSCATAEESFHMMDFYNANQLDNLLTQPGDNLLQTGNEYDGEGNQLTDYTHYLALDENGELYYYYRDTHFAHLMKNGYGYRFDFDQDAPYVIAYLGDTFTNQMSQIRQSMPLALIGDYENDDQYIMSIERKDGVLTVISRYPYTDNDESGNTSTQSIQSMDDETLVILTDEYTHFDQNGDPTSTNKAAFSLNVTYTMDERVLALQDPTDDTRTVTFVFDQGSDKERTEVFTTARNMRLAMAIPEGYTLFDDATCTGEHMPTAADADGNYPEAVIFYLKRNP